MMRVPSRVSVKLHWSGILVIVLLLSPRVSASASGADDAKRKRRPRGYREDVGRDLSRLYKAQPQQKPPSRKRRIRRLQHFGMKILLAGSGTARECAVNNSTKKKTYMKMWRFSRPGHRGQEVPAVWVFEKQRTWTPSSTRVGTRAQRPPGAAGAREHRLPGMSVARGSGSTSSRDGLAAELTAIGDQYYKDGDLN